MLGAHNPSFTIPHPPLSPLPHPGVHNYLIFPLLGFLNTYHQIFPQFFSPTLLSIRSSHQIVCQLYLCPVDTSPSPLYPGSSGHSCWCLHCPSGSPNLPSLHLPRNSNLPSPVLDYLCPEFHVFLFLGFIPLLCLNPPSMNFLRKSERYIF